MLTGARALLHVMLFYTCIEGLVINILYPAPLPYIYKDFVILGAYTLLLMADARNFFAPSPTVERLLMPMIAFALVILLYILMPGGMSFGAMVAVKQRLFYLPLIMAGYWFVRQEQDLEFCFGMLALYAIGVSLFGIYLYFAGPEGLRQLGASYSAEILTAAGATGTEQYWRVPGTFNSPGQYGAYLLFNGLIAAALLLGRDTARHWKVIAAVSAFFVVLAILVSGSRTPFLMLTAAVGVIMLYTGRFGKLATWSIAGYAAFALGVVFFGVGIRERFGSIVSYEHIERFQATYFGQMFMPALLQNPLGRGLGVATIGARHFGQWSEVDLMESYLGIIAVETGWLGVVAFTWLALVVLLMLRKLRVFMSTSPMYPQWLTLSVYVALTLGMVTVGTGPDHAPMNMYLWFSLGVAIRLADLQAIRSWAYYAQAQQQMPAHAQAQQQWASQPQTTHPPYAAR
jgi:hypothetical protein